MKDALDLIEREKQLVLAEAIHALLIVDGDSERCGRALCTVLAYLCPTDQAVAQVKENIDFYYEKIKNIKSEPEKEVGVTLFDIEKSKS